MQVERMKVALYARVSKADMTQNPDNQLIKLRAYAQAEAYEVYEEYSDMKSGADAHRPSLDRMMADARGHRFSIILVVKIDRIARSMSNLHKLIDELETFGIKFHCVDQPEISTDTPMGKLLLNVLGAIAEFERELIRERTKDGLARAVANGSRLGRKPKKIDMERVHELQAEGWGIRRIAKELNVAPDTLRRGLTKEGGSCAREQPPSER
jgi:DNA invertase Pin-like site-specific DNA recombinase